MGRAGGPLLIKIALVLEALLFGLPAEAETRLALIITNADYPSEIGALANPRTDGAVIAAALQTVGFEKGNIVIVRDADQPAFRTAVADFIERIEKAGPDAVAFLYYSGHGAADRTERGENYLIPVGAKITLAKQLPILGVSLTEITKSLERVPAKARFVVVDACRNVAFTKGLKDAAKGFVPERKLDGMIVAFATRPGETAEDNNIYASALASILQTPGLRAEEVFKETQLRVADLSKGRQIPWTEDGLLTRFKFKDAAPQAEFELAFWYTAKADGTVAALQTYLQRYPDGSHAVAAKTLIKQMRQEEASRAALEEREIELRKAEEAKRLAEAKREQEQTKAEEAKRTDELARAREELRKTQEAAKRAEAERAAALRAADQARRATEAATASVTKAAAEPQKVASLPQGTDAKLSQEPPRDPADLARSIQVELKRVGCDPGVINGKWGTEARDALRRFSSSAKIDLPSEEPSDAAFNALTRQTSRACLEIKVKPNQGVAREPSRQPAAAEKKESNGLCFYGAGSQMVRPCRPHP
jgi:uncharacterized caspase-like protein